MLLLTGWFDIDVGSVIELYEKLRSRPDKSCPAYLVVGPWKHMDPKYDLSRHRGPIDFGEAAQWSYPDVLVQWSDFVLKGKSGPLFPGPPIRCTSQWGMGPTSGRRLTAGLRSSPLPRASFLPPAPHPQSLMAPSRNHRPRRPQPGATYTTLVTPFPRPWTRTHTTAPSTSATWMREPDVLSFATAPIDRPVELRGSVNLELVVTSTAVDTDFCAWLAEEREDGASTLIASGFVRARYRNGIDEEQFLEPGKPETIRIQCRPTVYRLAEGSRLVVKISSSDFPDYDRNHNLGTDPYSDGRLVSAVQSLISGPQKPCSVHLPASSPIR